MGLGPSLSIRQSQQLVLTPQLRQAIQLLQLSNLELDAFLAEELSKNPLLEVPANEPDEQPGGDFAGDGGGGVAPIAQMEYKVGNQRRGDALPRDDAALLQEVL